jgi:hypothetical protein
MSKERQAEMLRREALKEKAKGNTWEEIKATVGGFTEAPLQTTAQALGSSVPIIAAGLLAPPSTAATGAGLAARGLAALRSPASAVGGAMGVGGQKGQDYETVKRELMARGVPEAEAEKKAQEVSGYSLENLPRQAASGAAGALEAVLGIEAPLSRLGKAAPKVDKATGVPEPTWKQAITQSTAGEAFPEAVQSAVGTGGTNVALTQAGIPTDITQGMLAGALHDALVGGTLGAGFSPAKMSQMRKSYVQDELARNREYEEQQRKDIEEAGRKLEETKQQFTPAGAPLALPAPAERVNEQKEEPVLKNPVGNLTPDELGPEVTSYINQYRKTNGLPRLNTYSIEDVKDAMTAVNPEGEKAALDSILTSKMGYSGQEQYTIDNVIDAAVEKNVATETKGFNDFLARTTGVSKLDEMSQPQLYAAFKALKDMPRNATGEQIVLPEGTNASRFKQDQYNKAIKYVGISFEENNNRPLSLETILDDVKESTGLTTDRDAKALITAAVNNGDLSEDKQTVYRTYKPDNDQLVSTYPTRERADAAAKKQGLNVREATLTQVAPKAPVTTPAQTFANLPIGYQISETQFKEGEKPEGFEITPEGKGKPLTTVFDQAEVEGKIERLSGLRQREAAKTLADVNRYDATVQKGKAALESMEARGETGTEGYAKAQAQQARVEDILGRRMNRLFDQIEEFSAPLKAKPVGKKDITRKGFTVIKDGKEIGSFPSRDAAEESILASISDEALTKLSSDKRFGGLQNRIIAEQNRRAGKEPTDEQGKRPTKKVSEVLQGLQKEKPESPEVAAKTASLRAMLNKFGLGDVGVKIVDAIENGADGSYAAQLIQIAMDAGKPVQTLRHEAIHALKELGFFTDAQWKSLTKQANDKWIDQYLGKSFVKGDDGKPKTRLQAYKDLGLTQDEIVEEAIADAFGDFDANKAPPGMLSALLEKMRNFFNTLKGYLNGQGYESYKDIFGKIEKGQLKADKPLTTADPSQANAWKATPEEEEKAEKYDLKNGIMPYVSEGRLNLPLTVKPRFSLKTADKYGIDPLLSIPLNKDGTVTVYYHTTKPLAVKLNASKTIPSEGRSRIYLTNESNGGKILNQPGNFDQEFDGSTVLLNIDPSLLQLDEEYSDGRKDFFVPLAQGDFFNRKMNLSSIQKSRKEGIVDTFSDADMAQRMGDAISEYNDMSAADQKARLKQVRGLLKREHNIGTLLSENGKLEKTRVGDYGLKQEDKSVASMGLGLASAQQITEKLSSCPQSAICEGLCLGETSGGNFLYGGAASEDAGGISKSSFRAGPRMMQYLKTEALVVHPEEFAVLLNHEISMFEKWSAKESERKKNKETGAMQTLEKEVYQPAIRLNVTSDFRPKMWLPLFEAHPDTKFYDYTKLNGDTVAPNHHLTYSSTGVGQVIDGEKVTHKTNNWNSMRGRLDRGDNVAMAFSSKSALPDTVYDEETGKTYQVWDGDNYDARFLDPKPGEDGNRYNQGMIIGLRNKASTLKEKTASVDTDGFFVDYDPKRDGNQLTILDQAQFGFKSSAKKVIPIAKMSLRTYYPTAEQAEEAAYQKAPPSTPEFKRWFANSTIKEEGRPQVMYHGTDEDFFAFRDNKPIFVSPDPKFAQGFAFKQTYAAFKSKSDYKIYPLWVRAEKPFDYENPKHVDQMVQQLNNEFDDWGRKQGDKIKGELTRGNWEFVESGRVQKALKELGFDSFYVQEDGKKNLAVFSASQVKSATGNVGAFGHNNDMRFSVRNIEDEIKGMKDGDQILDSIRRTTTVREEKGFVERLMEAIAPESISSLRQKALNRYNQLSVYDKRLADKMGGAALLADASAESAALMSDTAAGVAASVMGVNGRQGGVPVFKNGYTTVDSNTKGLLEIMRPLAEMGDPMIYRTFQFYAASKRGSRFDAEGREKLFTPAEFAFAKQLEAKYPMFKQVQEDYIKYNDGLVKYMLDTGVLTPEKAKEFTKYADYIPFYRQLDGEKTIGPNIFQSMASVKVPKKAKGDTEAPLADFLETMVRNTQSIVQSGMKNVAAQRALTVAEKIGEAEKITGGKKVSPVNTVTVLEKGIPVDYEVADQLFIEAVKGLNLPELPFLGILSGPSNLLRNLVTKDPGFMLANMMRDSLSAWVTSGTKMTPVVSTIVNFGRAVGGTDPTYQALVNAGIIGGYEFSQNVEQSGKALGYNLRKATGTQTGSEKAFKPITSLWDMLEKGTEASDAATRMAVYNDVLAQTGNEAEALFRALEVMNFNRKGNSAIVRVLAAAVPFLNARMQGLDVFYRASFGQMANQDAKAIQKSFFVRGATLAALSVMYWTLTHDDEEYKSQEEETRDNNWLIPALGVKIPIPFEVGILFKVVPERIMGYFFGNDTGKDVAASMQRALISTFAINPIPQTALPLVEVATNYSFFTMRPIVGQGLDGVAPGMQVGPSTTNIAETVGKRLDISPIKIDHIVKGYTGTMGMYLVDLIDTILDLNSDSPKAAKRFEQLPVVKRFAVDPAARGKITSYYDLKNAVDETTRTINMLERTGRGSDIAEYIQGTQGFSGLDSAKLFGMRDYISSVDKDLKLLNEASTQIRASSMSATDKRDSLLAITQAENNLTAHVRELRKMLSQ